MLAGAAEAPASEGESGESAPDIVEIPGDAALGSDAEPDEVPAERADAATTAEGADAHVETEHLDTEPNEAGQTAHAVTAESGEAGAPAEGANTKKTARTRKPPRRSSNRSAAPTPWRRSPIARRATAASTKSKR